MEHAFLVFTCFTLFLTHYKATCQVVFSNSIIVQDTLHMTKRYLHVIVKGFLMLIFNLFGQNNKDKNLSLKVNILL